MIQSQLSTEEKNWGMAAHLSALIAVAGLPFGHVVGPLIVYLVKGGQSEFVARHARASLNYQITLSLAAIVLIFVAVVLFVFFGVALGTTDSHPVRGADAAMGLGLVGVWVLAISMVVVFVVVSMIFIILGTVAASEGRPFHYPFAIRFIRDPQ